MVFIRLSLTQYHFTGGETEHQAVLVQPAEPRDLWGVGLPHPPILVQRASPGCHLRESDAAVLPR